MSKKTFAKAPQFALSLLVMSMFSTAPTFAVDVAPARETLCDGALGEVALLPTRISSLLERALTQNALDDASVTKWLAHELSTNELLAQIPGLPKFKPLLEALKRHLPERASRDDLAIQTLLSNRGKSADTTQMTRENTKAAGYGLRRIAGRAKLITVPGGGTYLYSLKSSNTVVLQGPLEVSPDKKHTWKISGGADILRSDAFVLATSLDAQPFIYLVAGQTLLKMDLNHASPQSKSLPRVRRRASGLKSWLTNPFARAGDIELMGTAGDFIVLKTERDGLCVWNQRNDTIEAIGERDDEREIVSIETDPAGNPRMIAKLKSDASYRKVEIYYFDEGAAPKRTYEFDGFVTNVAPIWDAHGGLWLAVGFTKRQNMISGLQSLELVTPNGEPNLIVENAFLGSKGSIFTHVPWHIDAHGTVRFQTLISNGPKTESSRVTNLLLVEFDTQAKPHSRTLPVVGRQSSWIADSPRPLVLTGTKNSSQNVFTMIEVDQADRQTQLSRLEHRSSQPRFVENTLLSLIGPGSMRLLDIEGGIYSAQDLEVAHELTEHHAIWRQLQDGRWLLDFDRAGRKRIFILERQ